MRPLQNESETINWMLNNDSYALHYKIYKNLLDYPEEHPEVIKAKSKIIDDPWIKTTLSAQNEDGSWGKGFYRKYDGTSWVMLHLSEIGAPAEAKEIQKGIDYLLNNTILNSKIKGYKARYVLDCPDGIHWDFPVACLTAHMVTVLIRYGLLEHEITQKGIKTCVHLLDKKEGMSCQVMDYYSLLPRCYMALPKVLKVYLTIPEEKRSPLIKNQISSIIKILKKYNLDRYVPVSGKDWVNRQRDKKADELRELKKEWIKEGKLKERKEKAGWVRFSFPLSYNSDLLEILLLLGKAGEKRDAIIDKTLEKLLNKKTKDNKWKMTGGLNGKMYVDIDQKGKPSPWITYRALYALKMFNLIDSTV